MKIRVNFIAGFWGPTVYWGGNDIPYCGPANIVMHYIKPDLVHCWTSDYDAANYSFANGLLINVGNGTFQYLKCDSLVQIVVLKEAWHIIRASDLYIRQFGSHHFTLLEAERNLRTLRYIGLKGDVDNALLKDDTSHLIEEMQL